MSSKDNLEKHRRASNAEGEFTIDGLTFRPIAFSTVDHAVSFGLSSLLGFADLPGANLPAIPGSDLDPIPTGTKAKALGAEKLRKLKAAHKAAESARLEMGEPALIELVAKHQAASLEISNLILALAFVLNADEDLIDDLSLEIDEAADADEEQAARKAYRREVLRWKRHISSEETLQAISTKVIKACKRFQGLDYDTKPKKSQSDNKEEPAPGNS